MRCTSTSHLPLPPTLPPSFAPLQERGIEVPSAMRYLIYDGLAIVGSMEPDAEATVNHRPSSTSTSNTQAGGAAGGRFRSLSPRMSAGARSPPQPATVATAARPPILRASRTPQRGQRELQGLADPLALRLNASSASSSAMHSPSLYSSHDPASYRRSRDSHGGARADGAADGDGRGGAGMAAGTPVREGHGVGYWVQDVGSSPGAGVRNRGELSQVSVCVCLCVCVCVSPPPFCTCPLTASIETNQPFPDVVREH